MTVENSPNSPECLDEPMETRKKVLYCFNKIFLKDNSSNEGKCWFFFYVFIETDFLDTRSYLLPANQNARLTILGVYGVYLSPFWLVNCGMRCLDWLENLKDIVSFKRALKVHMT